MGAGMGAGMGVLDHGYVHTHKRLRAYIRL